MKGKDKTKEQLIKTAVLVLLILLCAGATYYFHFVLHSEVVFSHLFYIPVALAGLWWGRRSAWVGILLGTLLPASHFLSGLGTPLLADVARSVMFVVVGLVVGFLREGTLRSEKNLRETGDYLDSLIRYANAPIIVWDPALGITRFNRAFEYLTGYTAGEVIGQELSMLFPEASRDESLRKIARTLRGEYWESVEIPILGKDEDIRVALWNSANIYAEDGTTLLATIAQGQDITERKQAEEALKESENKLRSILSSMVDLIFMFDDEGRFTLYHSPSDEELYMPPEQFIGKKHAEAMPPHVNELFEEAFESNKRGEVAEYEYWLEIGGETRWYSAKLSTVFLDGEFRGSVGVIRDITERKRAEEQLAHMATHDALTGLPNRMLFNDRLALALAHARRSQQMLAVMLLDLDHFKRVNDILGHSVGDKLLQIVGDRLASLLRKSDTVARMGGDEFMMLLPETTREEDVAKIAQKILETFREPFAFDDHELHITTSIGIAIYPNDGGDADALMRNADIAMYCAKDRGRDNYQRYTSAMKVKALE